MEAIRVFSTAHKALRKTMSEFLILAGQTNFQSSESIEKLKKAGNEMFFLLTSHADTEDNIILSALENKVPGASEHDKLDHIRIEQLQLDIENHLNRLNTSVSTDEAHEFYLNFASFFSLYLEHIDEEERVMQILIWENLAEEEQMAVRSAIVAKMDPETYIIWLKHMIPAQNEKESLAMLKVIYKNMPAERFKMLMNTLEQKMKKEDFKLLENNLKAEVV